ncbi:hypothetical protein [Kribbella sindirgiensis]|uniref:Uncharacterized protein n=1 Tax=Kribbella sindirgiensis TaxID=1124744 RepID=A0A4R0JA73_9ACTN|nr:hypothetical protein [Kribbella sindirgiensis]TCC43501.1 hypothetical protein E0H50_03305 [Kribbella sindirgiensis]
MDLEALAKAAVAVLVPVGTLIGVGSRRSRLRHEIRENLTLVKELEQDDVIREHSLATAWLQGKITVDVAKLAGRSLGTPKKPIPWGSIVVTGLIGAAFGLWTWYLARDGFVWYVTFPGVASALMLISIMGQLTGRELPPGSSDLPEGATPVRTDTAAEQIASSIALAASSGLDGRFAEGGQVWVCYQFLTSMREGRYEEGLTFADHDWALCRVQSWLWNNRDSFGADLGELDSLAASLANHHEPTEAWAGFVETETNQFVTTWEPLDPDRYGAASHRRRIARDYDLVILAPVGSSGGYFVTSATAVPNALIFVVHRESDAWLVSNHVGMAPPTPGWPPVWWATQDPSIEALDD